MKNDIQSEQSKNNNDKNNGNNNDNKNINNTNNNDNTNININDNSNNNNNNNSNNNNNNNNSQITNQNNVNNNADNPLNCSNLLTSNNFHQKKEGGKDRDKEGEKEKSKEKIIDKSNEEKNIIDKSKEKEIIKGKIIDKSRQKEKLKEKERSQSTMENKSIDRKSIDRSIDFTNMKMPVNNIIVDNQFLSKSGVKEKKKIIDSDVQLYQDFLIDGYKNALCNNKKNIIERLGDCVEKKYQTIEFWEKSKKMTKIPKEKVFKEYQKYQKVMMGTGYINDPKQISIYQNDYYTNFKRRVKHSYSTSNILDKKSSGDFPLLLSTPISYIKKFSSFSEKERNEKNILALLKLKHFLNMYWKKRKEIIKEFFNKFNINDPMCYKDSNLDNFANYINDNIKDDNDLNGFNYAIETRLPMIDIIMKGIKYKSYINFKKNKSDIKNIDKKIVNKFKNKRKAPINNLSKSTDELSQEKELLDSLITKEKITKYKSFLNRNYKTSVTNRLLKGLTKEEKLNYFSKKKYGMVEIRDKNNLANSLEKQALYIKRFNPKFIKYFNKSSIKYYNNDDLKKLNDELNVVSYSIVKKFESDSMKKTQAKILGDKKYKGLNDKIIDKLNQRLYYTIKEKYHLSHPEVIPTQKKKLLEYIIVQKIQERKNFEQKLLNDLK